MSGHSKWHSIKHKKALIDAKRGKLFTKVIKELQIAARIGGSDPNANPRLRQGIQAAKDVNLPKDTMDRAIKKGAGELEGQAIEQMIYEGYGAAGVAILVEASTDNRNRAASEIRHAFTKYGGNLGTTGCVGYLFDRKGVIEAENPDDDKVMEAALESGADDVKSQEGYHEIYTNPDEVQHVREALEKLGIKVTLSGVKYIPQVTPTVTADEARSVLKLISALEQSDDVDEVYTNLEIPEEVAAEMHG